MNAEAERNLILIQAALDDFVGSLIGEDTEMTKAQELGYDEVLQYVRQALGLPLA